MKNQLAIKAKPLLWFKNLYLHFCIDKMNNSSDSKFYHIIFKSTDNSVYIWGYVNKNCFYINWNEEVIREEVNYAEYDLKVVPKH